MKIWTALIMAAAFIAVAAADRADAATYYILRNYESEPVTFRDIETTEEIRLPKGSSVSYTSNKSAITVSFEVQSSANGKTYVCNVLLLDIPGSTDSSKPISFRALKTSANDWSLMYMYINRYSNPSGPVAEMRSKSFTCTKLYSGR